ncbi:hypothetical protein MAGR_22360 [Mycolicibacterium agri]|nr:hypothetical protein MAGR_22360 [Mycolicibacterium agri]
MVTANSTVIGLAPKWRPAVPVGDDRHEANAVLNEVLTRSLAFTDELRAIANRHVDAAPGSSDHVFELTAVMSRTILDWIERWPS